MRTVVAAFLCLIMFFTSTTTVNSEPSLLTPFVAAFITPEFQWEWVQAHPPDKLFVADKGWSQLPFFCREARKEAKGRPLVIDLTVHGSKRGLTINTQYGANRVSMGYVVNVIEQFAGSDDLTVLLESCYPGNAYFNTIRGSSTIKEFNHEGRPSFPIIGVGSGFSNWGNTVYLQWLFHTYPFYEDMRNYETKIPNQYEEEDASGISPTTHKLMMLFFRLYPLQEGTISYS